MNKEEIKEILNIERYRNKDGYVENIKLLPEEIHKLKDYITNLQEENERLNIQNNLMEQNIEDLQGIRDKAIEYINNNSLYEEEYDYDYEENIHLSGINDTKARNDLLNILKGE